MNGPDTTDIHNSNLIKSIDKKYKINELIPKRVNDLVPLVPRCSNSYLFQLINTWDKGSRAVRERILKNFVDSMKNATGPQLEKELNNGASLFLTRISAWLRLTYLLGYNLALQIKALTIFISAASGNRFLTEFLEVGGILTVLEILTINQAKEEDRAEALVLLTKVASNGRKFKEFICESYGVRQITECLSKSKSEITQDYAKNICIILGTVKLGLMQGNPRFQMQVFKGLQALLSSSVVSPSAQQTSAQALRALLHSTEDAPSSLIDPASSLLRSQHMQVQYEGYELLRELVTRPNCQEQIFVLLVAVLKSIFEPAVSDDARNSKDAQGNASKWASLSSEDQKEKERILAGYVQQAYAAKLVGVLIASNDEAAEKLIIHQVVSALLNVVANAGHPESQQYAVSNIVYLVQKYDYVKHAIREYMGENFYDLLENKPDTFFKDLSKEQIRFLRRNNVKIKTVETVEKEHIDDASESDEEHKAKKAPQAFPSAFPQEEAAVVKEEQKKVEVAPVTSEEAKVQQQVIMDSYENNANSKEKAPVDDMFTQVKSESGVYSTFPANKFISGGINTDRIAFETELNDFREKNNKRNDFKKNFEPNMSEELKTSMLETKTDNQLFSHEKMVYNIEKNMDESGIRQLMSTDDQAMLLFETNLAGGAGTDVVDWDNIENDQEQKPVPEENEDAMLDAEIGEYNKTQPEIKDDWNLEEEVKKYSRERTTPSTVQQFEVAENAAEELIDTAKIDPQMTTENKPE